MKEIIVHQVNIAHYRLLELTLLADQAKPFYDWIERTARQVTGSNATLNELLLIASKEQLKSIIRACYAQTNQQKPFLFDGVGRPYPHKKACFYFFAWMIRDAPQQRLAPLISRMQKLVRLEKITIETDSLIELIFEYRSVVKSFEWQAVREVVIDRLEGSRRSISGNKIEADVRISLGIALQRFFAVYGNYGQFKEIQIADKQIKIGSHTVDVSANLILKNNQSQQIFIPVKTRETEGGGHSHLFTRDIMNAITGIQSANCFVIVVIIAENWSVHELETIKSKIDLIFHFNLNPNVFTGFDQATQVQLNQFIEKVLQGQA
jgi:hypothetical protein